MRRPEAADGRMHAAEERREEVKPVKSRSSPGGLQTVSVILAGRGGRGSGRDGWSEWKMDVVN